MKTSDQNESGQTDKDGKAVAALETIGYFGLVSGGIICLLVPVILAVTGNWLVFFIAVFFDLVMFPGFLRSLKGRRNPGTGKLFEAVKYLFTVRAVRFAIITLFNILVLLKVGLQTVVPYLWILALVVISVITAVLLVRRKGFTGMKRSYYCLALAPGIISCVLLLNFFISFNKTTEVYNFNCDMQYVTHKGGGGGAWQRTTLIHLEGGVYEKYPGLRVFLLHEQLEYTNRITYTFRTGLFGIRVMTDYRFG